MTWQNYIVTGKLRLTRFRSLSLGFRMTKTGISRDLDHFSTPSGAASDFVHRGSERFAFRPKPSPQALPSLVSVTFSYAKSLKHRSSTTSRLGGHGARGEAH